MAFGNIGDVFYQLENLGFFDIVLPFLLIFGVVYGILQYMKIFGSENKGVHAMIAIILGLLAIRLPFFSAFLSEISPRLGVGLTILLGLLLLIGLFTPESSRGTIAWILLSVGAIIFIVILVQTGNVLGDFGLGHGFFSEEIIGWLVMVAVLIGVIVAVVAGRSGGQSTGSYPAPFWGGSLNRSGKD